MKKAFVLAVLSLFTSFLGLWASNIAVSPENLTYEVTSSWNEDLGYWGLNLHILGDSVDESLPIPTTEPTPFGLTQNFHPFVLYMNNLLYILWEQQYEETSQIVITTFDPSTHSFGEVRYLGDPSLAHRTQPQAVLTKDSSTGIHILHVLWWRYGLDIQAGYAVYCMIPTDEKGTLLIQKRKLVPLNKPESIECEGDKPTSFIPLVLQAEALDSLSVYALSPNNCLTGLFLSHIDIQSEDTGVLDEKERNHFPIVGARILVGYPTHLQEQDNASFVIESMTSFAYMTVREDTLYYQYYKNEGWSEFLPFYGINNIHLAKEILIKLLQQE